MLIAIDDGHGLLTAGKRTPVFTDGTIGATGKPWMHENEFNDAVAKLLDQHLVRCGFRTLLTTPWDKPEEDTPLATRTRLANSARADLFISIHANAMTGAWGTAEGVGTYYYPTSTKGKMIASIIQKHLAGGTPQKNRGIIAENFHVLRETVMPAVLVECAFMDNDREARLLLTPSFRAECAMELARGICEWFGVKYVEEAKPTLYRKIREYGSNVHIVEMSPKEYRLDITEGVPNKKEKLSAIFGEPKLDEVTWVRMNAQFFGGTSTRGYGSFIDPTDDLADKPRQDGYQDLTYRNGSLVMGPGPGDFTIGGSYGLISGGKTNLTNAAWFPAIMKDRNPRSMAGSLRNGNNVFVVVDGRLLNLSLGITATQQVELGHKLGFAELVNFDGGGSSQLMVGDQLINKPSDGGERAIVSAIVAYRKYDVNELPVIKQGAKGVFVNLLQRGLAAAGYRPGVADGIFGVNTSTAVRAFQGANKLGIDGIVGKQTWTKLVSIIRK